MRAVSFSDRNVQRVLNNDFVSTFTDTTGDPTAGMSIGHRPGDRPGSCVRGNGKQNVQTLFLTPEGEIFHAATGFLSADDLLEEAKFAHDLFAKIDQKFDAADGVVAAHRKRLQESGFSEDQMDDQSIMPGMEFMQSMGGMSPGQFAGNMNFAGSSSRNQMRRNRKQNDRFGNDVFASLKRAQFLNDNRFSIDHPLMPAAEFQRQPETLVGSGKSFFFSTSF